MATINCTEGWAARAYNSGWQSSNWQTDFTVQNSDGYCNSPSYSSTHGFVFRIKTPAINYFHKSTKLTLTLPVLRQTENYTKTGTLYFKILTTDPTPENTTSGKLPDALKITKDNCDASCDWGTWYDCHGHTVSCTITKTNLKPNTYYYIAVGGSQLLHIGIGWKGNSADGYEGNFTPDTGHWKAELTYETYTDGGNPSIPTLKDNGNNTVALEVKQGKSGTNNALTSTTLTYTIDGGTAKSLSITTKSEGTASYTIDVPNTTTAGSTGCTIKVTIKCTFEHNSTTASKSVTAYYYVAPGIPGKPALTTDSFKNGRLTIRQPWTYEWAAATAGNTKSPVKGYRIYLYKSGESIYTVDLAASELSYTFNPVDFGYKPKNTVALGIFAWAENGVGSRLWSGNAVGSSTTPLYSAATEIQNAGIVHVKVNGFWQEGQVWVKMNGSWNEAETVNTKVNGIWEESQ